MTIGAARRLRGVLAAAAALVSVEARAGAARSAAANAGAAMAPRVRAGGPAAHRVPGGGPAAHRAGPGAASAPWADPDAARSPRASARTGPASPTAGATTASDPGRAEKTTTAGAEPPGTAVRRDEPPPPGTPTATHDRPRRREPPLPGSAATPDTTPTATHDRPRRRQPPLPGTVATPAPARRAHAPPAAEAARPDSTRALPPAEAAPSAPAATASRATSGARDTPPSAGRSRGAPGPAVQDRLAGAARLAGAYLHMPDLPPALDPADDAVFSSVLRAVGTLDLGRSVHTEINLFARFDRTPATPALASAFNTGAVLGSVYRYPNASAEFWRDGSVVGEVGVDRFAASVTAGPVVVTAGRFAAGHSVMTLATVNDFFAPFNSTSLNPLYKSGVDALRVAVGVGALGQVEVFGALGYDGARPVARRSALLGRASLTAWNVEWAVLGGRVAERFVAGGSIQGDVGPVGVRAEGHVGVPDRDGDGRKDGGEAVYGRLSAGPNLRFDWHDVALSAEYVYLSDGAKGGAQILARAGRFFPDDLPYLGRHYVALAASMELTGLLRMAPFAFVNAGDGSGIAGDVLTLSLGDESELNLGVYVPWGKAPRSETGGALPALRSEFGAVPLAAYLETRAYF